MSLRLVQSADFERLLASHPRSRSTHFAVHHVAQRPTPTARRVPKMADSAFIPSLNTELSTGEANPDTALVDKLLPVHWLGCVVPKRHAKRAVTRNLLKRQIRSVFDAHASQLPGGQWLVRLRAPFVPAQFVSARSLALKQAARSELVAMLARLTSTATHEP